MPWRLWHWRFWAEAVGDPLLIIEPFVVAQIVLGRGQMPPFGDKLSDEQIAAVAPNTFRNSWGNSFGPVTPKDVADTRQLLKRAEQTRPGCESTTNDVEGHDVATINRVERF